MTGQFRALAARIRHEVAAVKQVATRAESSLAAADLGDDRYVDAAALNLHAFYSGIERLFEIVARLVDESLPDGPNWHSDLLTQVALPIADVRPAVISADLREGLDHYRGFRHVVRNVYTYNLDAEQIARLVRGLPAILSRLEADLLAFAAFLEDVAAPV